MPYGIVKEVGKKYTTVSMERQEMCGACHACEQLSGKKACTLKCIDHTHASVGEQVEIALANESFIKATYIMYGIPLVGFVIGLLAGYLLSRQLHFLSEDLMVIIFAMLGVLLGLGYLKWREKQDAYKKYLPHIVKRM